VTTEFLIYSRQECHLCVLMQEQLQALLHGHDFTCRSVKIDGDPELEQRYGARVPVLVLGSTELCELRLDKAVVISQLDRAMS